MSFHKVRTKKLQPNSCTVVAIRALTGLPSAKIAMAVNYSTIGTSVNKIENGIAALTGKLWLRLDCLIPMRVDELNLDKGMATVVTSMNGRLAAHSIAVIGEDVVDSYKGKTKITDEQWKDWLVINYFREIE